MKATLRGRGLVLALALLLAAVASAEAEGTRRVGSHKDVACLAVSPDGRLLASGGWDNTIRVWDAASGKELAKLEGHQGAVLGVAFSPDGKSLASGSGDRTARVWDPQTGKLALKLEGHGGAVACLVFSPDGKRIATGSDDTMARIFDAQTGKEERKLEGHRRNVNAIAFSRDGKLLATGSGDETVGLWDTGTWKLQKKLEGHGGRVTSVAFAPDGKTVVSGCNDQVARIFSVASGETERAFEEPAPVNVVAFSPLGGLLAVASMGDAGLYDPATGLEKKRLRFESKNVRALVFSQDGKTIATATSDGTIRVTDAPVPAPPPAERPEAAWKLLGIGDSFETETRTTQEKPGAKESVEKQRLTLKALDGDSATIEVVTTAEDGTSVTVTRKVSPSGTAEAAAEVGSESVEVPAGKIECRKARSPEARAGEDRSTTTIWTAPGIPVPVKRVLRIELGGRIEIRTTVLVKIEKR